MGYRTLENIFVLAAWLLYTQTEILCVCVHVRASREGAEREGERVSSRVYAECEARCRARFQAPEIMT